MTAPKFVLDYSFGHAELTPAKMTALGAEGGIAYAGCDLLAKNITLAEFTALIKAKKLMALVIENFAADALQGAPAGDKHGRNLLAAAHALGYDADNCVLFWGYDTDSHPDDWPKILAAMEAFATHIPVPGYYGDSDSIDYLHARHPHWVYWQSDSRSFSPKNPTPNAHLLQLYNDPRAHGAPVDVNNVNRTPLRFMNEALFEDANMADGLSPTAQAEIHAIIREELNAGVPGPHGNIRKFWQLIAYPKAVRKNDAEVKAQGTKKAKK